MPTSDEKRREVAENLRYLADYPGEPILYAEQFRDVLLDELGVDRWDHSGAFEKLADLIEPQERTCRILQAYGDESEELDHRMEEIAGTPEDTVACICQSCGHEFRYDRMVRPRFCPHCGCRVVSHDDN